MRPSFPSNRMRPSSAGWMPAIVLTSVDLPALLSPTSATTSPRLTEKSTSLRAWTGPKLLLIPSSASTGVFPSIFRRLLSRSGSARRRGRAAGLHPGVLLDARLLAGGGVLARADVGHGVELVLHDRVLDVLLRHRHRLEQDRRHGLHAVVGLAGDEIGGSGPSPPHPARPSS